MNKQLYRGVRFAVWSVSMAIGVKASGIFPETQVGLGGVVRYGHVRFANALYMAPEWQTNYMSGWNWHTVYAPQLNPEGYPNYLVGVNNPLVAMPLFDAPVVERTNLCVGRFALTWEGEADIRLGAGATLVSGTVSGIVLNGRRDYVINDGSGDKMMVRVWGINTNNPPRNIRLWLPDPADRMNRSLAPGAGQPPRIFHPAFLDVLRPFTLLRFMDWLETNNSRQRHWQDRRRPNHCFMTGNIVTNMQPGVSYEMCVALCNELGADMWLCVPHLATDEYVTNLARLIRFGSDGYMPYTTNVAHPVYPPLASNLRAYVEYSNEVWNPQFLAFHYAYAQGGAMGKNVAQYAGYRSAQIWKIFNAIWGPDHTQRIVRVGAGREGDPYYNTDFLNETIANGAKAHTLSLAPYFGNDIEDWVYAQGPGFFTNRSDANMQRAHDELQRRLLTGLPGTSTVGDSTGGGIQQSSRDVARRFGVPLVNYEGGVSIYTDDIDTPWNQPAGALLTEFMCDFNRHPRMAESYRINMNLCKAKGLVTHAMFVDISTFGKYGQWGHKEHTLQSTNQYAYGHAVKYKFMLDWLAEQARIRSIDAPVGAVPYFTNSVLLSPMRIGRRYGVELVTAGGDGARAASLIKALLPQGMTGSVTGVQHDRIRVEGTPAGEINGGWAYVFARVLDADGDPAWGRFEAAVVGGPGTIVESDFTGPNPALRRPWTNTYFLAPGFVCGGWNNGAGVTGYAGTNFYVFSMGMPPTESTLEYALANNQYVTLTVTPPLNTTMDLRGASVRFTIGRIGYHAARRYALFCSIAGFGSTNAALFISARSESLSPVVYDVTLPHSAAYQSVTTPVEFRIYGFSGQYGGEGHKTSLMSFKLRAQYVTFNQQPIAVPIATSTMINTPVTVVVTNDCYDWDGDALSIDRITQPAHGTATFTTTSIVYTPPAGYLGTVAVGYVIKDGRGATDASEVQITVIPEPGMGIGMCLAAVWRIAGARRRAVARVSRDTQKQRCP